MFSMRTAYIQIPTSTKFVGADRGSLNLEPTPGEGLRS
jgi:hypothetical protein